MGRKLGGPRGLRPIFGRGEWAPSITKSPGPRPSSIARLILIQVVIWSQQIWAENRGLRSPLWGTEAGSPFNTMWPGPRPTCVPSFILIRPTVWPQCTNVTDRAGQTGQDRQTDTGVKLLLKGCGSPTELMAEIQIPMSRQVDQDATLSNTVCPADCVRWGPSSPRAPQQGGTAAPLLFGPCALWPNGCMDQDATWYGCRPRPRPRDVRWDLAPPKQGGTAAHVYCGHANGWTEVQRYRPQSMRRCVRLPLH